MLKLSIIIPAYNEEKRIKKTLNAYSNFLETKRKSKEIEYEILVSINNTKDKTKEIVEYISKKNKRIRHLDLIKGGKGYAVIEGFKDSLKRNNDLIGFIDADMATLPQEYWKLIKTIIKTESDGVIASRYLPQSKLYPKFTFRREIVGKTFNLIVRILFFLKFKDTQCGAKIFTRRSISHVAQRVVMSKWAFDVELVYRLNKDNFKIKEVPTIWYDIGGSKINIIRDSIKMFLAIVQLRLVNTKFKLLFKVVSPLLGFIRSLL